MTVERYFIIMSAGLRPKAESIANDLQTPIISSGHSNYGDGNGNRSRS